MSATTTERPKTLDQARTRIAELESQLNLRGPGTNEVAGLKSEIAGLKSQLVLKDGEIRRLSSGSAAPATNQPTPQRPLAEMSRGELAEAMDVANAAGDRARLKVLYAEVCRR